MKRIGWLAACVLVSVTGATIARADADDDTLRFFLSKSELVLAGEILNEPLGVSSEYGVVQYYCEFRVQEVLKGDASFKGQVVKIAIVRAEKDVKDRHPLVNKNSRATVFLKSAKASFPEWQTADFWFGLQPINSMLSSAIMRLSAAK